MNLEKRSSTIHRHRHKMCKVVAPFHKATALVFFLGAIGNYQHACCARNQEPSPSNPSKHVQPKSPKTISVVYAVRDVPDGSTVSAEQLEQWQVEETKIVAKPRPIHSLSEAVGRVARRGLYSGQIICEGDLTPPRQPQPGEKWLFSFPSSVLSSYVGDVITVKGRWLAGDKRGFEILDYNATGHIYVNIPNPTTSQQAAISQFAENQCVVATGRLQKSLKSDKSPSTSYSFDAQTVVLRKSQW